MDRREADLTPKASRATRQRLGLTQEQFAREIGVTLSTVSRWEANRARPRGLALRLLQELRAGKPFGGNA